MTTRAPAVLTNNDSNAVVDRPISDKAGVQEYFQIECRTRVSRSIFRLNVQEN